MLQRSVEPQQCARTVAVISHIVNRETLRYSNEAPVWPRAVAWQPLNDDGYCRFKNKNKNASIRTLCFNSRRLTHDIEHEILGCRSSSTTDVNAHLKHNCLAEDVFKFRTRPKFLPDVSAKSHLFAHWCWSPSCERENENLICHSETYGGSCGI